MNKVEYEQAAAEVAAFFDADTGSKEEFARTLAGIHADRGDPPPSDARDTAVPAVAAEPTVVLKRDDVEVTLGESLYEVLLREQGLQPPEDDKLSRAGVRAMRSGAVSRGMVDLVRGLNKLDRADEGNATVLRPSRPAGRASEDVVEEEAVADDVATWADAAEGKKADKLIVSALGGHTVEVERAGFEALARQVPGGLGADFGRAPLGHLISLARSGGRAALLRALLAIRSETAPLYRVRTPDGRVWQPGQKQMVAAASEAGRVEDDFVNFFGGN